MKIIFVLLIVLTELVKGQNPPQWIIYNTSNSLLPSNEIYNIAVDNINKKWISFVGYGLLKIENEEWTLYNTSNSNIPFDFLNSLNVDENSNFWAGSGGGNSRLTKFDGINWIIWDSTNSPIPEDHVMSLVFDNQNELWLLCMSGPPHGINYLLELTTDSVWNFHASFTTVVGKRQMLFDANQILWIGVWNGLYKYDGNNFTFISEGSLGQYVTDIKIDTLGNIWMATGAACWGGLIKFDGQTFTYYNIKAYSIEIDTIGNLWVGTEYCEDYSELLKYDGYNWVTYNHLNSLLPATLRITDIAIDKFGNLWIGTQDSGLIVFNENGIVVPVELQSFTAKASGNDIQLDWSTATETNNEGFEILRSTKNNEWKMIVFVEGYGTTTEPQFYSFTDESLQPGIYQYKLKQIDFDGSFEYSKIVEVTIEAPTEFSLSQNYPNPFNPVTKIKYSIPSVALRQAQSDILVTLKVYDVLGIEIATLVNEEKPAGIYEITFDGTGLPSGIYLYQLKATPNGEQVGSYIETKKMVLLK